MLLIGSILAVVLRLCCSPWMGGNVDPLAAAAAALIAPVAPAQVASGSVGDEADDRARAMALLARAARFQLGESAAPEPSSFFGHFFVTVRDQGQGAMNAEVKRWYTRNPERIRTWRMETLTGSRQVVGSDGERTWFQDEQSGRVVVYSDEPENFDVDLQLAEEQKRLTRLLLDSIVLQALIPSLNNVRLGPTQTLTDPDGEEHPSRRVIATIPDDLFPPPLDAPPPMPGDPPPMIELDFAIDVHSGALWSLGVRPVGRDDYADLELRFAFHVKTDSGLMVPGNVRVFADGQPDETVKLGLVPRPDGSWPLEVGLRIADRMFTVPE